MELIVTLQSSGIVGPGAGGIFEIVRVHGRQAQASVVSAQRPVGQRRYSTRRALGVDGGVLPQRHH